MSNEIRVDYKLKLKEQIGWEIEAGRKESNSQSKWIHHARAMALWSYGINVKLLNDKEATGIYRQILNFSKTIN